MSIYPQISEFQNDSTYQSSPNFPKPMRFQLYKLSCNRNNRMVAVPPNYLRILFMNRIVVFIQVQTPTRMKKRMMRPISFCFLAANKPHPINLREDKNRNNKTRIESWTKWYKTTRGTNLLQLFPLFPSGCSRILPPHLSSWIPYNAVPLYFP